MKKFIVAFICVCMMFLLTACSASDYKNATALLTEGKYEEAIAAFEALGDYKDSAAKIEEAKTALKIENAKELLCKGTWFFNGGSDSTVNNISFTKENAIIGQTYFDGNGAQNKEDVNCSYTIDSENIIVTLADMSELKISYEVDGDEIELGEDEYFTPEEVEEGLEGYWTLFYTETLLGSTGSHEYIYHYKDGKVVFESASTAYGTTNGEYYYYGPHSGTYKVDENGLTVDARNSWQFGFNIIDGEVVMVRCERVCKRTDGFKGENGFDF